MWRLYLYRLVSALVCRLPRAWCYRLARLAGSLLATLPTARRAAVRENLAVVYGADTGDRRVRRDTRRSMQHVMLNYVDLFRLSLPETTELVRRIHVPTLQPLDDALAAGKGAIIATAHVGNLETIVQKLALRGDKVLIPVEPIRPPALLELIRARRGALGIQIEPIGADTFRQMTAHLREGGIVIIVSDRDVQGTGQLVPFFGRMVRLPNAAILLALRTGAPLLVAFGYRHRDNRISGRVAEPLEFGSGAKGSGSGSLRAGLEEGMRALAAIMEQEIRHDPGQWLVQQPVFRPAVGTPEAGHGNASRRPTTNMLSRESSA